MNFRYLIAFVVLMFGSPGFAQTPADPAAKQSPAAAQAPASQPQIEATKPTSPLPAPLPEPPQSPPTNSPVGLLILAIVMAHVSLPITLAGLLLILIVLVRVFKSGLTKFLMQVAAAGGGVKALKGILVTLGCIVVLPAGLMGLNFAAKILDQPVNGPTWWIYGLAVSVLTGMVFFALMKKVGQVLKKQLAGKMGGGFGGMMGGMGGFGGMGGMGGMKDPRKGGKPRRR